MQFYISPSEYINTSDGFDLSIPVRGDDKGARAWYVNHPTFEPVRAGGYVGSVQEDGSTNFRDVYFNPHGHGTHTECLGHITPTVYSINDRLKDFHFRAEVVTVVPVERAGDLIIEPSCFAGCTFTKAQALIIRTQPNAMSKKELNYSNTNPPYLDVACMELFNQWEVEHLLIDLPSVDRESDGGVLAMHNAFWNTNVDESSTKTITEFIYVKDEIVDGSYILNLQVAAFENDAAPSRPVIYPIKKED